MVPESRDDKGKLKVGYFKALGYQFKAKHGYYDSSELKAEIQQSGILRAEDWQSDGSNQHTWQHRVDRATQKINTGI